MRKSTTNDRLAEFIKMNQETPVWGMTEDAKLLLKHFADFCDKLDKLDELETVVPISTPTRTASSKL